jgi:hypothetical protein
MMKGGSMSKQDQNGSSQSNQARKQSHSTPQGSHKEKAPENQRDPAGEGAMQGTKSQDNKKRETREGSNKLQDFDRNEGEQRSQKI